MRSTYRILNFGIAILLLIIILLPGRGIAIHYVVDPITRILWWMIRIFLSIDQKFYWTILIFLIFIFCIYLIPSKDNHKTPSAYKDPPQKEDRFQFWKRIVSSAHKNDADRMVLQSNLNQLQKEVSLLCENSGIDQFQLTPITKRNRRRLFSINWNTTFFSFIIKKHSIHNDEFFDPIQDFLKSIENTMEIKNGNFRNKSSDS